MNKIFTLEDSDIKILLPNIKKIENILNKYQINSKLKTDIKKEELFIINDLFLSILKKFISANLLKTYNDISPSRKDFQNILSYVLKNGVSLELFSEIYFDLSKNIIETANNSNKKLPELDRYKIEVSLKKQLSTIIDCFIINYKKKVSNIKSVSRKKLEQDFFYMFSSSSQDILKNYLVVLEIQHVTSTKILKRIQSIRDDMYINKKENMDEKFYEFVNKQAVQNLIDSSNSKDIQGDLTKFFDSFGKMFSSENTILNKEKFLYSLMFIFNGFKFLIRQQNLNIDMKVDYSVQEEFKINIHEYNLMIPIMTIYQNAIESGCSNLEFIINEDKNNLFISIVNNGEEIKKEFKKLIFEDFFTTKEKEEYCGYGLSIAKQELKKYNSYLELIQREDSKTEFRITLPKIVEKDI